MSRESSIMGESWQVNDDFQREKLIEFINANKDKNITFKLVKGNRTSKQNSAIHAYCREVARELAAGGHDFRNVLKQGIEIEPSMELVKKYMWVGIQQAMFGKDRTSDLDPSEVDQVYEVMAKALVEKYNVNVQFGSK